MQYRIPMIQRLLLLVSAIRCCCILRSVLFVRADSIDDAVNEWMIQNNARAVSVTFYDGSDPENVIDISRGYGKISSSDDSADATADTPFSIASLSKIFTATAVGVLVDKGIIQSTDDDICDTIPPDWGRSACRNPRFPNVPITWRMLMTHRSGLVRDIPVAVSPENGDAVLAYWAPSGLNLDGTLTYGNPTCPLTNVQEFYRVILTNDPNATTEVGGGTIDWYETMKRDSIIYRGSWIPWRRPGRRFGYSNYAYGYISALVEMASSMPFESFCQKYIFEPLMMTNTSFFRENLTIPSEEHAMPVRYDSATSSFVDYGHTCFINYAAGNLYTTVHDIAKFLRAMFTKGVPTLWSGGVGDLVLSCPDPCPRYRPIGFGWWLVDNTAKRQWSFGKNYNWTNGGYHFGGNFGISTFMMVLPSSNVYVAVLAKSGYCCW